jgi:hypothetical protein
MKGPDRVDHPASNWPNATAQHILLSEADFPTTDPLTIFACWTEPALLEQWWQQHAKIGVVIGATFQLT